MDFFTAQQQAERKSRWLVFWFACATLCIIILAYALSIIIPYVWNDARLGAQVLAVGIIPVIIYLIVRAWQAGISFSFVMIVIGLSLAVFLFAVFYQLSATDSAVFWEYPDHLMRFLVLWVCVLIAFSLLHAFATDDFVVAGIVMSFAYVVCTVVYFYYDTSDRPIQTLSDLPLWEGGRFFWIFLLVGGGIVEASLYKMWQISRHGGALIAEQLGGKIITRNTYGLAEKRLLNVVDEMSIAAGIPAPTVFLLAGEPGINAFAAGLSTRDSVIGVTRGLLNTMNRDELQGVIAHEISHIVNGDSRLNLKLIGILHGIYALTIMGRGLTRVRGPIAIFGFSLRVVGSIGFFFGRLIQAAISREREYLADAFAVQFTRNPAGLAAALHKLQTAGSEIQHPKAIAASHLFFGASTDNETWASRFAEHVGISLFSTHPPLSERIARIGGIFLERSDEEATLPAAKVASPMDNPIPILAANPHAAMPALTPVVAAATAATLPNDIAPQSLHHAQLLLAGLPTALRQKAQGFSGAIGILAGLLFSGEAGFRQQQEKLLSPDTLPTAQELYQWLSAQPEAGARYRLIWLDLILPVLREALKTERQQALILAKKLIQADGKVSISEFALYNILYSVLLSPAEQQVKQKELRLEQLDKDIADLLALLAHAGNEDAKAAEAAYQAAMICSPAGTKHSFPAKSDLSLNRISEALSHLALATPPYRKKLLEACSVAIQHDGKITPVENELLRAFAQSLDCPAPLG